MNHDAELLRALATADAALPPPPGAAPTAARLSQLAAARARRRLLAAAVLVAAFASLWALATRPAAAGDRSPLAAGFAALRADCERLQATLRDLAAADASAERREAELLAARLRESSLRADLAECRATAFAAAPAPRIPKEIR